VNSISGGTNVPFRAPFVMAVIGATLVAIGPVLLLSFTPVAADAAMLDGASPRTASLRPGDTPDTAPNLPAHLATARPGPISAVVPASGEIEPYKTFSVRPGPNVPARTLREISVREGDRVTAGEILFVLNDQGLALEAEGAEARLHAARVELERMQQGADPADVASAEAGLLEAEAAWNHRARAVAANEQLLERGLIAEAEHSSSHAQEAIARLRLDASRLAMERISAGPSESEIRRQEALVAQLENERDRAELALEETTVRAPHPGTVAELYVRRGDIVDDRTLLATLMVDDTMILRAGVDESDLVALAVGQPAVMTPFGLPGYGIPGTVSAIDQRAKQQGSATVFYVDIVVANPDGRLKWGMTADAEIVTEEISNALLIPHEAVRRSGRDSVVTVVRNDGSTVEQIVRLGMSDRSVVQVLDGLQEGDVVALPSFAGGAASIDRTTGRLPSLIPTRGMIRTFRVVR